MRVGVDEYLWSPPLSAVLLDSFVCLVLLFGDRMSVPLVVGLAIASPLSCAFALVSSVVLLQIAYLLDRFPKTWC